MFKPKKGKHTHEKRNFCRTNSLLHAPITWRDRDHTKEQEYLKQTTATCYQHLLTPSTQIMSFDISRCFWTKAQNDHCFVDGNITIIQIIAVFCGTDIIMQNIPHVQHGYEEYFVELSVPQNTAMGLNNVMNELRPHVLSFFN